jgi:tRNA(fMet)-specific endonuclease VapC
MFCLDTNIVIFAPNKRKPWIATRLENELRAGAALIVPAIVLFELDYGIAKIDRAEQARAVLEGFLSAGIGQPAFEPRMRATRRT